MTRGSTDGKPEELGVEPDALLGRILYDAGRDLGELEEVVVIDTRRYFVIDARHWSFGSRKLVPVYAVRPRQGAGCLLVGLDAESVRGAPDFDPFQLSLERYARHVTAYYESRWTGAAGERSSARPSEPGSVGLGGLPGDLRPG